MTLGNVLRFFLRWSVLLILAAILGGIGGFGLARELPSVFQGSVTLLVGPGSTVAGTGADQLLGAQQLAQTYAEAVRARPILTSAAAEAQLDLSYRDLQDSVHSARVPNTQLLRITADAADPADAAALANAVAQVFVASNLQLQTSRFASSLDNLSRIADSIQAEIDARNQQLSALQAEPASAQRDADVARLQAELVQLDASRTATLRSLEDLRVTQAQSSNVLTVIDPAVEPESPIRPNRLLITAGGAAGLMLLALLIAMWLEQRRDPAGDRRHIGGLTGAPILGSVPRGDAAMSVRKPTRRVSESYRLVRTSLEAALTATDAELRTMIVVSAARREGRSTTATHMALALAESGRRVVLVDADMHNPRQAVEFELDNQRGLSNLLHDPDEMVSNVLAATWVPLLSLIPAGPTPADPSALLSSKRLAEVIVQLRDVCDVVVFDTPSLLAQPDAALLASKVDAVLLVVDVRRSRGRQVKRAVDLLNDASSAPIGVVINRVPAHSSDFVTFEGARNNASQASRESVATDERHGAPTSMPASASDALGGE